MNWAGWFIWGFAATVVLTTLLSASHGFKLTRVNIPFLLGTMVTPDRDRAKWVGMFIHLLNGWIFSLIYILAFQVWGEATPMRGALIGLVHGSFVLVVAMPFLLAVHPRMASESFGPTVVKLLEPPGFLCLNYGMQTPISVIVAHVIYGMILGTFYKI